MELKIELDKDFENEFNRLKDIYPKEMFELEGLTEDKLDPTRFFKAFIHSDNVANASIDDNANVNGVNINTLLNESKKPFDKLLGFNKIFIELKENHSVEDARKWLNYQISGTTYIHDSACLTHYDYCYNYSLRPVVDKGLFFIPEMRADAPNHLNTFNHHVLQFVSFASTQQAGAVGLSDYLLYSYYFWQKDVKDGYIPEQIKDKYRDQYFQSMIFDLNQPFMKITQSAYTNFTIIDREYFVGLFGGETFPDGSYMIDHVEEFMQYQKDWLRVLSDQRAKKSFTFPVVSLSAIYKEGKYLDEDLTKYVVNHNMIWGDVNMYNSNSVDKISSCCRLVNDAGAIKESKKLEGHFNSIGGSSMSIGSTKVNTINLPRIGYMAKGNFDIAKDIIKDIIVNIHKSLHVHRIILRKNIERGLLPLYTHGLKTLESQFGTVGITGVMEYIEVMGGIDRDASGVKYNKLGLKLAEQTLKYINELNENTLSMYGFTANVEQIPGESATIKLCKKDKILFGDIVKTNIYSNQWIALSEQADLMERIRVSGVLDGLCGGGQMLHICLGENYTDFKQAWRLCKLLAKKGVIYYSDIKKFQYCKNDHSFFGKTCSICGEPAIGDIVKIVGYLVKNAYFKKERKTELEYRVQYKNVNLAEILANDDLAEKIEMTS